MLIHFEQCRPAHTRTFVHAIATETRCVVKPAHSNPHYLRELAILTFASSRSVVITGMMCVCVCMRVHSQTIPGRQS